MSKPQRAMAAFGIGAALFVSSAAAMITIGAAAHGPGNFFSNIVVLPLGPSDGAPSAWPGAPGRARAAAADADRPAHRHRIHIAAASVDYSRRQPVCVRLCDGYFFPTPATAYDVKGQEAQCASQCPDAPTEVYYQNGSDRIEDAISPRGQLYSALPVSLRYRSTQDNTCACRRDNQFAVSPLNDVTLKRGDAVMTPAGFLVFKGVEGVAHSLRDFAALKAATLSRDQRNALQALERVSVLPGRLPLPRWLAASTPSAAPAPAPAPAPRTAQRPRTPETKIRLVAAGERPTN